MKQIKDDNKGLSILEVLVAMVILAIVVTPFLRAFVTTANANLKARNVHRATIVGQNIMEAINAENLESIATQFNYPSVNDRWRLVDKAYINNGTDLGSNVYEVRPGSGGTYTKAVKYEEVPASEPDKKAAVTSSICSMDTGVTGEFLGQSSGIYHFVIRNLKQDKAEYDILVGLDATSVANTETEYNDDNLVQLPILDQSQDAVCIEKWDYIDTAMVECGVSQIDKLDRVITVKVDKRAVDNRVTVAVTYQYENRNDASKKSEKTVTYFDSSETGRDLRSVYLYFTPLYPDAASQDVINYENFSDVPVNLCLFKQKVTSGDDYYAQMSAIGIPETSSALERAYKMTLNMDAGASTYANSKTKLYGNLHKDMTDNSTITTPLPYAIRYKNVDVAASINEIIKRDKVTRAYNLTVSVYEKGAAGANFPATKLLTTIEGSYLD